MHGEYDRSLAPRVFLTAVHLAAVALAIWLLVGGGLNVVAAWRGAAVTLAAPARRWLLAACAGIYFLRVVCTTFYLLKRKMDWKETTVVGVWVAILHLVFAYSGGTRAGELGWGAAAGALLYVAGSVLNSGSELQRKLWKQRPENAGRLYTGGFFRWAMHVNYFGDELLFTGYALATGVVWTLAVPLLMAAGFVFFNIPELDRHLRAHYGAAFDDYARRTRKFVPFVY